jgi:hypothetical protein
VINATLRSINRNLWPLKTQTADYSSPFTHTMWCLMPYTDTSITSSQTSRYLHQTLSSWLFQSSKSHQWCERNMRTSGQGKNRTEQLQYMQHDNMYDKLMINKHKNTCWNLAEWWWWCSWLKMIGVIKWQEACARGQSNRFTQELCILWLLCLLLVFIHLLARWYIYIYIYLPADAYISGTYLWNGLPQGTDHLT